MGLTAKREKCEKMITVALVFLKGIFYKNVVAEIDQNVLKNMLRTHSL